MAIYQAQLHSQQGDPQEALTLLDAAQQSAGADAAVFTASIARVRALTLAEMGRFDEAAAVVEEGLAEAQRQGLSYDEALLLQLAVDIAKRSGSEPDPGIGQTSRGALRAPRHSCFSC